MLEIFFILVCLLIYMYSFLYRNLALIACAVIIFIATYLDVNIYFVLGVIFVFTVVRLNKTGVRDEF